VYIANAQDHLFPEFGWRILHRSKTNNITSFLLVPSRAMREENGSRLFQTRVLGEHVDEVYNLHSSFIHSFIDGSAVLCLVLSVYSVSWPYTQSIGFFGKVKFEHTTPLFERAKAVHALNRAITATGNFYSLPNTSTLVGEWLASRPGRQ
jgi:hypothetical protein